MGRVNALQSTPARFAGKRIVGTDCDEFMGPDIVSAFSESGATVIADRRDLTAPGAASDLIEQAGHVDVLVANLAFPYATHFAHEIDDDELARTFDHLVFPLHRLVRAVFQPRVTPKAPRSEERRVGKECCR